MDTSEQSQPEPEPELEPEAEMAQEQEQEKAMCSICFDSYPLRPSYDSCTTSGPWRPACGHSYCNTCLVGYFSEKISTHTIDITCPECPIVVEPDTVRGILFDHGTKQLAKAKTTEDARALSKTLPLAKYDMLSALANDPRSAACPRCATIGRPASGRKATAIECGGCGLEFCTTHGDAHPGRTCQQFERSTRKAARANEKFIARTNKIMKCPKCLVNIEKNRGCSHMYCTQCKHDFCWCCGRNYDSRLHFDGNIWLCPAQLWGGDNWGWAKLWSLRTLHVTLTPVALGLGLAAGSVACVVAPPVIVAKTVRNRRRRNRHSHNLMYLDALQIPRMEQFPSAEEAYFDGVVRGDASGDKLNTLQKHISTVPAANQNYGRFSLVHTRHQEWLQQYCTAGKLVEARYPPNGRYYPATISKVCHFAGGGILQAEVEVQWDDGDHQHTRRPTIDLRPRSDEAATLLIQKRWRDYRGVDRGVSTPTQETEADCGVEVEAK